MSRQAGFGLVEALVVAAVVGMAAAIAFPAAAALRNAGRATAGARVLAGEMQALRWRSVAQRRAHGLVFARDAQGWIWRVAADGNGNGIRTSEVARGVDPVLSGPHRLEHLVEGARLGAPPGGPHPEVPPRTGAVDPADPVAFGSSNVVAFGPLGSASSGTVYLTDGRTALQAVVLFGPTSRVRVWSYDTRIGRWTL